MKTSRIHSTTQTGKASFAVFLHRFPKMSVYVKSEVKRMNSMELQYACGVELGNCLNCRKAFAYRRARDAPPIEAEFFRCVMTSINLLNDIFVSGNFFIMELGAFYVGFYIKSIIKT